MCALVLYIPLDHAREQMRKRRTTASGTQEESSREGKLSTDSITHQGRVPSVTLTTFDPQVHCGALHSIRDAPPFT